MHNLVRRRRLIVHEGDLPAIPKLSSNVNFQFFSHLSGECLAEWSTEITGTEERDLAGNVDDSSNVGSSGGDGGFEDRFSLNRYYY